VPSKWDIDHWVSTSSKRLPDSATPIYQSENLDPETRPLVSGKRLPGWFVPSPAHALSSDNSTSSDDGSYQPQIHVRFLPPLKPLQNVSSEEESESSNESEWNERDDDVKYRLDKWLQFGGKRLPKGSVPEGMEQGRWVEVFVGTEEELKTLGGIDAVGDFLSETEIEAEAEEMPLVHPLIYGKKRARSSEDELGESAPQKRQKTETHAVRAGAGRSFFFYVRFGTLPKHVSPASGRDAVSVPTRSQAAGSKGGFKLRESDRFLIKLRDQGQSYSRILEMLKEGFPDEKWGTSRNLNHRYQKARKLIQDVEKLEEVEETEEVEEQEEEVDSVGQGSAED
jgi:hypothetical protein